MTVVPALTYTYTEGYGRTFWLPDRAVAPHGACPEACPRPVQLTRRHADLSPAATWNLRFSAGRGLCLSINWGWRELSAIEASIVSLSQRRQLDLPLWRETTD